MSRVPSRKPRPIARSSELSGHSVTRTVVPKAGDPRQGELFEVPFAEPMKPKLATKPPEGSDWLYEIKHDGWRAQCHVFQDRARIYTKKGLDVSASLPVISAELVALPVASVVLDAEACMVRKDGSTDFFALHAAMARKSAPDAVLYCFDILHLDGEDLRKLPLIERRAILAELLVNGGPHLELSDHYVGDPKPLLRAACDRGLEGVVAKRKDARYRSGYVETWLKVKCTSTEVFAVTGYEPDGQRGVKALKVATLKGEELVPCGCVGSGLSADTCSAIRAVLDNGRQVVVDVEYRGWTPSGELRHAVFKGWHEG